MGSYALSEEEAKTISKDFDQLRFEVRRRGLLDGETPFFLRKLLECVALIGLALLLQLNEFYIPSALALGVAWQQLGWMIHEYSHHQHFKVCSGQQGFGNFTFKIPMGNFRVTFGMILWRTSLEASCKAFLRADGKSNITYVFA